MKSRVNNTTGIYAVLVAAECHDSKLCAVCNSVLIYAETAVTFQGMGMLHWSIGYYNILKHIYDYL
jgi:hypothetical protein